MKNNKKLSTLAYVPLDLPKIKVPYSDLIKLFNSQGQAHYPYPSLWHSITVTGNIKNFQDPIECDTAWKNRYSITTKSIKLNPFIPYNILKILLKQISALPYKVCMFSQILSQQTEIPPHKDGPYKNKNCLKMALKENPIDFSEQPEPAGLKILLSHTSVSSLYVCKTVKSRRQFIRLPKNTTSFALNERTFFHGAKAPKKSKFILSTFGIIDKNRHKNLMKKSLRRYGDKAIWF
ncbi:MAG: hypothetical protein OXJ52_03535 [Oligoflexia bacterium]|nr:hypothetical protein [Oligoflexia bacterium]